MAKCPKGYKKGGTTPDASKSEKSNTPAKSEKRAPIYVTDKNDPRYKTYSDSLFLHKEQNRLNNIPGSKEYNISEFKDTDVHKKGNYLWLGDPAKGGYVNMADLSIFAKYDKNGHKQTYKEPVQPVIYQPEPMLPIKMDMRGVPADGEPELMPQRQQAPMKETKYTTKIETGPNYHIKKYYDDANKVVKEEYYDFEGNKIDPSSYKDGGKVQKLGYGGVTNPAFNNNIQGAVNYTNQNQPQKQLVNQGTAAAGLNLVTQGLNAATPQQDTEMKYGTNAYFDKYSKNANAGAAGYNAAQGIVSGINPLAGSILGATKALSNTIAPKDAYGVRDKGDAAVIASSMFNPLETFSNTGKGIKEIGKGNIGKGLAYLGPLGGVLTNDERKNERAKLQYQSANTEADNQFTKDKATQDTLVSGRVQQALAARDAGDNNYVDTNYIATAKRKDVGAFQAPEKSKILQKVGLKDGGQVKGKGTGTSDSIKAKVEPGSFVVPAKNSGIAKRIREQYLGGEAGEAAELEHENGEDVRLSNNEHLFSPEEVKELMAAGIDLDKLAPESKSKIKDHFKNGGTAMNYNMGGEIKKYAKGGMTTGGNDSEFVKSERAKIEAERKANAKAMGEAKAKVIADRKSADLRLKIYQAKEQQLKEQKASEAEHQKAINELNALRKSYDTFDKQAKASSAYKMSEGEKMAGGTKPSNEELNKNREDLLNKISAAEKRANDAKSKLDYTANEGNYVGDILGKKTPAPINYMTGKNTNTPAAVIPTKTDAQLAAVPAQTPTNVAAKTVVPANTLAPAAAQFDPNAWANTNPGPSTPEQPIVAAKTNGVPTNTGVSTDATATVPGTEGIGSVTNRTPAPAPQGSKIDANDIFGAAISYGIPLAQTLIGFNQLKKAGDRPIDSLSPDYIANVNKAKYNTQAAEERAKFGLSPEEIAQLNMQNTGLTNASRFFARNNSGGNAASALNSERAAVNDSFGRNLQTKVLDQQIKRSKYDQSVQQQGMLNDLIQNKQNYNRLIFGDALNAWNQKQQAAAGLINTGLTNASDAYFANKRTNDYKDIVANSNPYKQ